MCVCVGSVCVLGGQETVSVNDVSTASYRPPFVHTVCVCVCVLGRCVLLCVITLVKVKWVLTGTVNIPASVEIRLPLLLRVEPFISFGEENTNVFLFSIFSLCE